MKTLGFMTILYGKEYLEASLLSIKNHVEKMVVAYSEKGSHGFHSPDQCPDSEQDIYSICKRVLGDKLIWHRAELYHNESQHRAVKYLYSSGYDLILTIDADEVFKEDEISRALQYASNHPERHYGIKGYVNFWRSFNWACYDGFRPIRIENLNSQNQSQNLECPLIVYHFSTAQSEPVMRYKYSVFGHSNEIKEDWLNKTHYGWTPDNNFGNLHCVANDIWNAVPFDRTTLPKSLKTHANYNMELI